MKKVISIASIVIIFVFYVEKKVNAENTNQTGIADSISVSTDNINLILWNLSKENFDITIDKGTIFMQRTLHEGIDNLQIQILSDDSNNTLKGEIVYGVIQYLTDDSGGAISLDFHLKIQSKLIK